MELKEINEGFANELMSQSSNLIIDIAEIGLDNVFESGIVEEIPVIKTIAAVCKIGLNIRDRFFAKI